MLVRWLLFWLCCKLNNGRKNGVCTPLACTICRRRRRRQDPAYLSYTIIGLCLFPLAWRLPLWCWLGTRVKIEKLDSFGNPSREAVLVWRLERVEWPNYCTQCTHDRDCAVYFIIKRSKQKQQLVSGVPLIYYLKGRLWKLVLGLSRSPLVSSHFKI